jgi:hypothetical protein
MLEVNNEEGTAVLNTVIAIPFETAIHPAGLVTVKL